MTQYKLIYFNGRGRAEIIRLVFAAAGVQYIDERIPMDKWAEYKKTTPMGQIPLLEFDGERLCQSISISRYLARKFGLAGKTELEDCKVDVVVDCIEDTVKPIVQFFRFEKDEQRKAELKRVYIEESLPGHLANLEKLLKTNHNGDGYFVGDSLTWADLHFLTLSGRFELQVGLKNVYEKFPKLKALEERILGNPKIAEYVAKRPVTTF